MNSDDDVWERYAKGVKKIEKPKIKKPNGMPAFAGMTRVKSSPTPAPVMPAKVGIPYNFDTALDRRIEKNMRQGDIVINARIDLHGMRQDEAHDSLARFMATQAKAGKRNLLIITGKGSKGNGVLRANLPGWLGALPEAAHILTLRAAAPKHGGDGAFYVVMRKKK